MPLGARRSGCVQPERHRRQHLEALATASFVCWSASSSHSSPSSDTVESSGSTRSRRSRARTWLRYTRSAAPRSLEQVQVGAHGAVDPVPACVLERRQTFGSNGRADLGEVDAEPVAAAGDRLRPQRLLDVLGAASRVRCDVGEETELQSQRKDPFSLLLGVAVLSEKPTVPCVTPIRPTDEHLAA